VEALESRVLLAVITVTTTADDGPGSLRQAILDANATPTIPDTIRFNIPGTGVPPAPGVRTIRPLSPLPLVVGPTSIDAKTQPGSALRPMVELDGSAAGPMADGIVFGDRSYSNLVRGLVINRFSRHGIVVDTGAELTQIESNYIGTDATGQIDLGNGSSGVVALGKAFVGGMRTADADPGNVISGNEFAGVWVNLPGWHVDVYGNRIGTDTGLARPDVFSFGNLVGETAGDALRRPRHRGGPGCHQARDWLAARRGESVRCQQGRLGERPRPWRGPGQPQPRTVPDHGSGRSFRSGRASASGAFRSVANPCRWHGRPWRRGMGAPGDVGGTAKGKRRRRVDALVPPLASSRQFQGDLAEQPAFNSATGRRGCAPGRGICRG